MWPPLCGPRSLGHSVRLSETGKQRRNAATLTAINGLSPSRRPQPPATPRSRSSLVGFRMCCPPHIFILLIE